MDGKIQELNSLKRFAAFLLLLAASPVVAENHADATSEWTQWRGPDRDSQVYGPGWPDSLGEDHLREIWRAEVAPGYSGPIVSGDRVYVAESRDGTHEFVRAFDRKTGEKLWETGWEASVEVPMIGRGQGNWIKSTPAFDGKRLYVLGMEDVMVALDGKSGDVAWRIDFKEHFGTEQPEYGSTSSPLIHKKWVFVQAAGRLVRLNRETGEVDWHGLDTEDARELTPFSSPVIAMLAGREQLVAFFPKSLAAIDPDTCDILWQIPVETALGAAYPTPLIHNDDIFLSLYGRKTHLFRVSQNDDGTFKCEPVWENKAKGYLSTPVIVDGHAYVQLTNRRVICINLETGEDAWGTSERYDLYWGLTANDDKILALENTGELRLIHASTEKLDIIDTRKVSEGQAWAPIAFVGNEVYIRDNESLTRYVWD